MKRWTIKTTIGLTLWGLTLLAMGGLLWRANQQETVSQGFHRIVSFWTTRQQVRQATPLQTLPLNYNDPVFQETDEGFQRIAQVISNPGGIAKVDQTIQFRLFGDSSDRWDQGYLEVHRPARNLGRVAEVMLTDERLERIKAILEEAQQTHQRQVIQELTPLFREALGELRPTLETELLASIRKHRPEMDLLVDKYKERIVKEKLVPVVETQVLPVVQRHAQPLMEEIGGELWGRVSLWRFAWRFLYDESIEPNNSLVDQEWQRFLRQEAIPAVRSHTDDIVQAQAAIIEDLAANPVVRDVLRESFEDVVNDEEAKRLIRSILQDGLTRNQRVLGELQAFFQAPRTRAVLRRVGDRFEPYAVRIGQELFGTPDQVTKEFALVLRHMILHKDQRWLVWKPGRPPGYEPAADDGKAGIPIIWTAEISMPPFFQSTSRMPLRGPEETTELTP